MTGCGSSRLDISPNSDGPFCLGIQSICGILKIQWGESRVGFLVFWRHRPARFLAQSEPTPISELESYDHTL